MNDPTPTGWAARLFIAGSVAALALIALVTTPSPARAFWIGVGWPFGYYAPGPYYGYYPPPYYYPPAYGYYPPGAYYPPAPAPSANTPPAVASYTPQSGGAAPAPPTSGAAPGTPKVTYTNKPAFNNSAGQTCREYKTTDTTSGHSVDVFGTACKQADGQWRVVN